MESEHYTTHFQDEKNHLKEEGKIRSLSGETDLAVDRWGVGCVRPWIQSPARKEGREKERGDERGRQKRRTGDLDLILKKIVLHPIYWPGAG